MSPLRIIVPLLTVAASVYGTYQLMGTITPDSLASPSDRTSTSGSGSPKVSGSDTESLLRAVNLAAALRALARESATGRSASIRLAADRLDTRVPSGSGSAILQINTADKVSFRVNVQTPASREVRIAGVRTTAPETIVRAIAERQPGTSLEDVDYMVLSGGALPGWSVFLTSGKQRFFRAQADGRRVIVPGEPTSKSSTTKASPGSDVRINGKTPEQITQCIQRASGDVQKMSACVR